MLGVAMCKMSGGRNVQKLRVSRVTCCGFMLPLYMMTHPLLVDI